jgi:hypothetical protein
MKGMYGILLFSIISLQAIAQNVTGHWYGVGKVAVPGEHSSYMSELIIQQKGAVVTGELQYYFRDSLFKVKVNGSYNNNTRRLSLNPVPFIYYLSTNTKTGIDCMLSGNFILLVNRTESILIGAFESDDAHRYTTPDIQFRFRYSTDTASVQYDRIPDEDIDTTVTTTQSTASLDTVIKNTVKEPVLSDREKVYVKEVTINSNSIRIDLYDNGSVDNDSVAVYINDRLIIPPSQLTHRAIRRTITLDSTTSVHELSMVAINLGNIPPNTAALIIYDGDTRHELILTSDLNRTATIRLRKR